MNIIEFDQFADEYVATHAKNIKISGEDPDYFARYKVEEIRRRWSASKRAEPAAILDFGTGIGNSLPFLTASFPTATVTGLDVSDKCLGVAERRFPGVAELVRYDGQEIPIPPSTFDLIFSACVFHHIDEHIHVPVFGRLKGLLKPGGLLAIFEHNPFNPVTRHIVATCPFDENAILISPGELKQRQAQAGFREIDVAYTGFFPRALSALRPLERFMTRLPFGAQYYTLADA